MIINPYMFGATYDTDALAYFTANTSITSSADKSAINDFYLGLKSDSIYTSIQAMYLPIWGSTNSKWNLITPVDNDASFRLTFSGGLTYASTGITPNGTTGYANTYYNVNTSGSLDSSHVSFYSRTSTTTGGVDIGCKKTSFHYMTIGLAYFTSARINSAGASDSVNAVDTKKLFIATRTSSSSYSLYKNASLLATVSQSSSAKPDISMYLFARNTDTGIDGYSVKECSFSSIGAALNSTQVTALNSRVTTLLTYFGINV